MPHSEDTDRPPEDGRCGDAFARVRRAYKTLSAGNRTLLRASSEDELLRQMCQVIVAAGGYRLASVGYAEADPNKTIRWVAYVGPEPDLGGELHFSWADTEWGQSASAVVIRSGEPVIGRKILTDPAYGGPAFARLREDAASKGYFAPLGACAVPRYWCAGTTRSTAWCRRRN